LKQVWLSLFDSSHRQSEIDELLYLRAELLASVTVSGKKFDRLLELMLKYQDDQDLVYETLMQLDANAVAGMYQSNPAEIVMIIERFVKFATSQSWPFDYTDKIGTRCLTFYNAIPNYEIRAALLQCVMEVGVSHNRWNVLGIFADLIQA